MNEGGAQVLRYPKTQIKASYSLAYSLYKVLLQTVQSIRKHMPHAGDLIYNERRHVASIRMYLLY